MSSDGETALECSQSVWVEVNLESFPKTNLVSALHNSARIFLEKKIYLIIKFHMYICTEYIKYAIYIKQQEINL